MSRPEFRPLDGQPTVTPENCYCLRGNFFSQCTLGIRPIDLWLGDLSQEYPWLLALRDLNQTIKQHRLNLFLDYTATNYTSHNITASAIQKNVLINSSSVINSSIVMSGSKISDHVTIYNSVIYPEVSISEGAVIKNSVIGRNSYIGNNALIHDSIIGQECQVGFFREISRAIVGLGTRLDHPGTFLDSIACNQVWLAGFTGTRNMRRDKEFIQHNLGHNKLQTGFTKLGVIIGPNSEILSRSVTMPGILIGSRVVVWPDTVVSVSLPDSNQLRMILPVKLAQ